MSGKNSFTAKEWAAIKDAPQWVYAALAAADGRASIMKARKEVKAFEEAVTSYNAGNRLIKDVLADDDGVDRDFKRKSLEEAEEALSTIGDILDEKGVDDEADGLRAFLLEAGEAVAEATGESLFGKENVSDEEKEALNMIAIALKATPADKSRRSAEADRAKRAEQAKQRRADEAKRKAAAAKRQQEADAKKEADAADARRAEMIARKKAAEERAKQEKLQEELAKKAEEARQAAKAEADAKARQAAILAAAKERRAKLDAQRKVAAEAAAAAETARQEATAKAVIQEQTYTVQAGDNLSKISRDVYGTAARWKDIFNANRDTIKNANLIYAGQVLRIP
jgi:nucleoid-associated protein YgaU